MDILVNARSGIRLALGPDDGGLSALKVGIKPTHSFRPFAGLSPFDKIQVQLFGRNCGLKSPVNWSIAHLKDPARVEEQPVNSILPAINFRTPTGARVVDFFAPRPSNFNGHVCNHSNLTKVFKLGTDSGINIHRGVDADGCDIPKGKGFILTSADCPTIIIRAENGNTYAAHAGRDCLFDRSNVCNQSDSTRKYPSVVDALVARALEDGCQLDKLMVFITCGISPNEFGHSLLDSKYGDSNSKMVNYFNSITSKAIFGDKNDGRLDLKEIIIAQFEKNRIPRTAIKYDDIDTIGDKGPSGEYSWWSCRRTTIAGAPDERLNRNLVVVINEE